MNMMMNPGQCPLFIAAVAAFCGVSLIAFSNVHSATPGSEQQDRNREPQLAGHQRAFAALRNAGVSGIVDVADYGHGLGLGVTQNVEAGAVLLRVPDFLALDVRSARSCRGPEPVALDCEIEKIIVSAVSRNETSRLVGLISLLVMELRRGSTPSIPGLERAETSDVLSTLPDLSFEQDNGIFATDEEEFKIFSVGTSMEGWRELAVNATVAAHTFILAKLPMLEDVTLQQVRWAYLMLQSHAQWEQENVSDFQSGLDLPAGTHFLWPLFLSRPTPEWQHGVRIRYDQESRVYEVVTTHAMRTGDEVHFVDRRLSDASVLSFQGLWLTGRHRMRLTLNVSSAKRDPDSLSTLHQYNCGTQPLQLYVMAQKSVDAHFMSCMRMLALAANHTRLKRAQKKGWLDKWPVTGMVDQKTETAATELGINALQQVLGRLGSSSTQMRQRFGNDAAAARPTVHVREAETMIVVGLLKSMKELQLVSSSEYLFEAIKDSEKSGRPKSSRQAGRR